MSDIWKKLNLKDHRRVHVLNVPACFEPHVAALADVQVSRSMTAKSDCGFVIAFVTKRAEIARSLTQRAWS